MYQIAVLLVNIHSALSTVVFSCYPFNSVLKPGPNISFSPVWIPWAVKFDLAEAAWPSMGGG